VDDSFDGLLSSSQVLAHKSAEGRRGDINAVVKAAAAYAERQSTESSEGLERRPILDAGRIGTVSAADGRRDVPAERATVSNRFRQIQPETPDAHE
jgi:hypothetical protein